MARIDSLSIQLQTSSSAKDKLKEEYEIGRASCRERV